IGGCVVSALRTIGKWFLRLCILVLLVVAFTWIAVHISRAYFRRLAQRHPSRFRLVRVSSTSPARQYFPAWSCSTSTYSPLRRIACLRNLSWSNSASLFH